MGADIHEAARGFSRVSDAYVLGRPTYPREAVAVLARELRLGPGRLVVDLAAGTGKLTALLVGTGAEVVAVEPLAEMRAALELALPEVRALDGTAERMPLAAESVDAVTVGQAFHWFRGEEALPEIHRVLRPGGGLGLVWNFRDESVGWLRRLTEILEPLRGNAPRYRSGNWQTAFAETRLFGPLRHEEFSFVQRLEPDAVVARVDSVSFVASLPPAEREAVLAEVRDLLARDPDTRGRAELELPHRTDVFWCERLGRGEASRPAAGRP
ncbi:MAG TPA: class I SAM-dependent methyltransferase [Gaiellaceae bacterium]|nr:class I SAM-dependent methyltransferase [Gaiellaceae bacterium]